MTPPIIANGMLEKTSTAWRSEPKVKNSSRKISGQRDRHHDREPRRGALLVLELAAPGKAVTRSGSFTLRADRRLGLGDEADQVAAADIAQDDGVALAVLADRPGPARPRGLTLATWASATQLPPPGSAMERAGPGAKRAGCPRRA